LVFSATLALLSAPLLAAQPTETPPAAPPAERSPFSFTLAPRGQVTFAADLRDGPGRASVSRAGLALSLGYTPDPQWGLSLDLDTEASFYNFKNATALTPAAVSEPFDDLYQQSIAPRVVYIQDKTWSYFAGATLGFAGEPDADAGDAFTAGGFGGVRYAFSETFALSLGLAARSRLEDDATLLPLIGVEWQITPKVRLETERLGLRLSAKLSDAFTFFAKGGYELREFRLEDDSVVPAGVVRDRRLPVAVGLTYSPAPWAALTLSAGADFIQEYRIDNQSGDLVGEDHTDAAPTLGLELRLSF
jgi:hypothetical protein